MWPPSSSRAPPAAPPGPSSPSAEPPFGGCWFFPHFPPGEERFPNAGMEHEQEGMDSAVRKQPAAALGRRDDTLKYISLPLAPLYKRLNSRWMIKPSRISSIFYSALQALCFMFPIASPEINQSHTCSRPWSDGEDHPPCRQSQEGTAVRA